MAAETMRLAAVVLAGGQGLRMGGADKGLAIWQGKALVDWMLEGLRAQQGVRWDALALNANRNLDAYAQRGLPLLQDAPTHRGQGPLAGMLQALHFAQRSGCDAVWVLPCDTPLLPHDLALSLVQAMQATGAPAVVPALADPGAWAAEIRDRVEATRGLSQGATRSRGWPPRQAAQRRIQPPCGLNPSGRGELRGHPSLPTRCGGPPHASPASSLAPQLAPARPEFLPPTLLGAEPRWQAAHALLRSDLAPALQALFDQGERRLQAALRGLGAQSLILPGDCSAAFGNFNHLADLQRR